MIATTNIGTTSPQGGIPQGSLLSSGHIAVEPSETFVASLQTASASKLSASVSPSMGNQHLQPKNDKTGSRKLSAPGDTPPPELLAQPVAQSSQPPVQTLSVPIPEAAPTVSGADSTNCTETLTSCDVPQNTSDVPIQIQTPKGQTISQSTVAAPEIACSTQLQQTSTERPNIPESSPGTPTPLTTSLIDPPSSKVPFTNKGTRIASADATSEPLVKPREDSPGKPTSPALASSPVITVDQLTALAKLETVPAAQPQVFPTAASDLPKAADGLETKISGKEEVPISPKSGKQAQQSSSSTSSTTPATVPLSSAQQTTVPTLAPILTSPSSAPNLTQNADTLSLPLPQHSITTTSDPTFQKSIASPATTPEVAPGPQALPVINTSKLIQNLGQTEMRVGMHSAEFGNISIRTSSTPDLISAQISLDHSDLAKVLSTHLPEMQTKLGNNLPGTVQIHLSGTDSTMSGDPANASSRDSQQPRQSSSSQTYIRGSSQNGTAEASSYSTAVAAAAANNFANTRLDVRV